MAEEVFVTRSAGIGCQGIQDQYADGRAAQLWEKILKSGEGDSKRKNHNSDFLVALFKNKGCRRILDVACGTGVDSVMLVEAGFQVTSVDASDKMLKHALKKRWNRRKEPAFDKWVIEEGNWLTLPEDVGGAIDQDGLFDAIICLGNSFAHLVELSGDQSKQRLALRNFEQCIKPGGILVIDHRNFDSMLDSCSVSRDSIYYNFGKVTTSVLYTAGRPVIMTLDYFAQSVSDDKKDKKNDDPTATSCDFRLSYYPHRLKDFTVMLDDAFPNAEHTVLADFKSTEIIDNPGFYIHVLEKPM